MSIQFNDYNKYTNFPLISKNIIEYLILNNENIWKLLSNAKPDVLKNGTNLTLSQKSELIYKASITDTVPKAVPKVDSSKYRVFTQPMTDDSFNENISMLRIFPVLVSPENRTISTIDIGIQCLVHNKINPLIDGTARLDWLYYEILSTLNGAIIPNTIGQMYFDQQETRRNMAGLELQNNRNYIGWNITMSLKLG